MRSPKLACRVYESTPQTETDVVKMLKESVMNSPIIYGTFFDNDEKIELAIVIKVESQTAME